MKELYRVSYYNQEKSIGINGFADTVVFDPRLISWFYFILRDTLKQ